MRPRVSYKINPTPKQTSQSSAKIVASSKLTWDPQVMMRKYTDQEEENRFYFFLADAILKISSEQKN